MRDHVDLFYRAEEHEVPLSALVELTHACNVDCEHCYLELQSDHKIGALTTDEWKRIFRELAEAGCLYLTLSGGELLVRRDWFDLGLYARQLGFALRLYTNGTLIDDRTADQIARLAPLAVEISLHGASAASQDAVTRRAGSFERALRGVRRLRARGIRIVLKSVVMKRNIGELRELRALAAELGTSIFFDVDVTPKNDGTRAPVALAASEAELAAVAAELWPEATGCAHSSHFDRAARLADAPCAAGRRTCHIGPTGDLFPCTQWTQPVGSLRTHRFAELWREAPALQRIRATHTSDLAGCRDCELLEVCTPCMALSLLEHGNLAGPSPTKCRSATARARALGVEGRAAGSFAASSVSGDPGEGFIPLGNLVRAPQRIPAQAPSR